MDLWLIFKTRQWLVGNSKLTFLSGEKEKKKKIIPIGKKKKKEQGRCSAWKMKYVEFKSANRVRHLEIKEKAKFKCWEFFYRRDWEDLSGVTYAKSI